MAITVSVLQGGTNSHATTSEEVNYLGTDFVSQGVVGTITNTSGVAPATGAMAVNAQGTPDMTVAVSAGVAYVTATPTSGNSQLLRVKNSASSNVTIAANSTGGTRYDWVYVKIDPDKAKDPNSGASDVATLVTSRSTSSGTDNGTPPTYATLLAVVTVANGASSITNGNIADKRTTTGPVPGDATILPYHFVGESAQGSAQKTSWAWQTWTPTLTSLSGGAQTYANYIQIGKTVHFRFKYTLGGAGVSGAVSFTLPVTSAHGASSETVNGTVYFQDTGTANTFGAMVFTNTTTVQIIAQTANGTYVGTAGLSSTVPHTWANTDVIYCAGTYEAA